MQVSTECNTLEHKHSLSVSGVLLTFGGRQKLASQECRSGRSQKDDSTVDASGSSTSAVRAYQSRESQQSFVSVCVF